MRKVTMIAIAIILWLIPIILLVAMLVPNVDEMKTVDLAAIKSGQIIMGTNEWIKPDFTCPSSDFMGKSYELVMVGVTHIGKIIYLGKTAEDKWYQAKEELNLGLIQKVKEAKIDSKDLVIYCGKSSGFVTAVSIISFILLGFLGFVVFAYAQD